MIGSVHILQFIDFAKKLEFWECRIRLSIVEMHFVRKLVVKVFALVPVVPVDLIHG